MIEVKVICGKYLELKGELDYVNHLLDKKDAQKLLIDLEDIVYDVKKFIEDSE